MLFAVFEYKGLCPDSVDGDCKSLSQFHRMAYPMERITKYCSKPLAGLAGLAGFAWVKNLGRCTQRPYSSFIVHRSPFTVHRSPFIIHRSSFTILIPTKTGNTKIRAMMEKSSPPHAPTAKENQKRSSCPSIRNSTDFILRKQWQLAYVLWSSNSFLGYVSQVRLQLNRMIPLSA